MLPLYAKQVIVQGITGTHGTFHTKTMLQAGIKIIAGTSPNKAGQTVEGVPVFSTIADIKAADFTPDTSVIFVPAAHAKAAIMEAIDAEIPLIVCITEGVPIHDMLIIKKRLAHANSVLIGPNSPGVLVPNTAKLGIIPASVAMSGSVGVVSRSGTLTYEIASSLTKHQLGQSAIIGIGGDPVKGVNFIDALQHFEADTLTDSIVMIGEIGGSGEAQAAEFIKNSVTKPVFCYIAGHQAPVGIQLGHAGAILRSSDDSAGAKTKLLQTAGARTFSSLGDLTTAIINHKKEQSS